jgi:phosphopantothenoylcysteine synthetase/decarboxylase
MNTSRLLTVVICAAGPAPQATQLVSIAKERGWAVRIRLTEPARAHVKDSLEFFESHGQEGEPDAIIIAPATFNTINKLANGSSDERHLDFLHPRIQSVPTAILPFVNKRYASRTVYQTSLEHLRKEGVSIIDIKPHEAGSGGAEVEHFPWKDALDKIEALLEKDKRREEH